MKIQIFYSWQDTTIGKFNRYFISDCLERAIKKIKKESEIKKIEFKLIEGVRDMPGSPPVASTITDDRIPNSDILIFDLSVVNYMPKWIKFFLSLLRYKHKPFQNNNVVNEYGVGYNALGVNKIIGVLNSAYGSPKESVANIPFDISYLRFPIEYSYSKKTKDVERKKVRDQLVGDLKNAIEETAKYALTHQKQKYNPFIVWSDWDQLSIKSNKYYAHLYPQSL